MIYERAAGTRHRPAGYLLASLVAASMAAGCGMFDIRPPTPPGGPEGGVPRANPIAPESVLYNVTQAIRYQLDGVAQYEESLAEQFHLVLDENDVADLGGNVDSLSKTQTSSAQRIRSQESAVDSFYFGFDDQEPEKTGTTAFYFDIPYTLQVLVPEGDTLIVTLFVTGRADLSLLEGQTGKWVMSRWVDKRVDPHVSFGRWHGEKAL